MDAQEAGSSRTAGPYGPLLCPGALSSNYPDSLRTRRLPDSPIPSVECRRTAVHCHAANRVAQRRIGEPRAGTIPAGVTMQSPCLTMCCVRPKAVRRLGAELLAAAINHLPREWGGEEDPGRRNFRSKEKARGFPRQQGGRCCWSSARERGRLACLQPQRLQRPR